MDYELNLNLIFFKRQIWLSRKSVQVLVVLGTILLTLLASYWGTMPAFIFILGLAGALVALLILMKFPNLGFVLLIAGGMFVPFAGPGGFNAAILTVILMVVLWLLDMFIVKREFQFVKSRALRPVVIFMVVSLVAFGMGQISWFAFGKQAPFRAQLGGFAIYFFSLAIMLVTANMIRDLRWLKTVFWVFIGLGTIYIVGNAAELPIVDKVYQKGVYANSMFWTLMVALVLGQAIFNHELSLRSRIGLYLIVAVTFFVAFYQQNDWKSGWVPPAVCAMALVGLRYKKLAIMALPFSIILGVYLAQDLISTDQYSWGTRVDAWLVVLDISRTSPLIGLGFANYYWYASLFSIRGYNIRFNSHSQFVDIIAQTGVAGLLCFLWILAEVGILAWGLSTKLKTGFARGYAYGMLAGAAGTLMAAFLVDWVLPFAYNIGLDGFRASVLTWVFFGGLISLEQMHRADKNL